MCYMKSLNKRIYIKGSVVIVLLLALVSGCKKMDDTYREFIGDGETIYVGKADSLKLHGGKNRLQVFWLLISDPKVSGYKVLWNAGRDSLTGNLVKTPDVDTVRLVVNNMEEGSHHFDVYLYDSRGNSSVKTSAVGKVYGERYRQSLLNRAYRTIKRVGDHLVITWMPAEETLKEVVLKYTNSAQEQVTHVVPAGVIQDTIRNFPRNGEFVYSSVFKPEPDALDVFATEEISYKEVASEVELEKTGFKHFPLPTDTYKPEFDSWAIANLWDGTTGKIFYVDPNIAGLALPNWFTIDLTYQTQITRIRVNQLSHHNSFMFSGGAPKEFEIYGSNAPAADGSWDSWTLLGSFTSAKPSGLPIGQLSEADIATAVAGETFSVSAQSSFRYLRFRTKSTYGGNANVMIAEMTLWGYQ